MGNNKVRPLLTILSLLICIGISFGNNIQNREKEYIFEGIWNPDSVEIDNGYFRVMQNSTYCNSANTPGFGTRVIVALDKIKFKSSTGKKKLERGNVAVFPAGESYRTPKGDYFEVAFKTNHPPLQSPDEWIEPVKNKIVYEDDQFRIFEERLDPGDTRELHSHAQRIDVNSRIQ